MERQRESRQAGEDKVDEEKDKQGGSCGSGLAMVSFGHSFPPELPVAAGFQHQAQ